MLNSKFKIKCYSFNNTICDTDYQTPGKFKISNFSLFPNASGNLTFNNTVDLTSFKTVKIGGGLDQLIISYKINKIN